MGGSSLPRKLKRLFGAQSAGSPPRSQRVRQVNLTLAEQDRRALGLNPKGSRAQTLAPSFASYLQYASLRGHYALLDSPLPALPGAIGYDLQRGSVPSPRHCEESLMDGLASLR
jgi:hypothetical protein